MAQCDPNTLARLSSCFRCLTDAQLMQIRTYLLCQWARDETQLSTPSAPSNPDLDFASRDNDVLLTWTNGAVMGSTNEIWRSTDGVNFVFFASVGGGVSSKHDLTGMAPNTFVYYKIRSCNGSSCSAFTSVVSACLSFVSPNVASVSFPTLVRAFGNFNANGLGALTSVSLPALKSCLGNIDISNNANLTSVTLTALQSTGGALFMGSDKITGALSLPALISTGGDWQLQGNTLITSVSAPLYTTCGGIFSMSGLTALTAVTFTSLQFTGSRLDFNGDTSITSLSFPALTTTSGDGTFQVNTSGCTVLASWSAPNWLPLDNGMQINLSACALNVASVNQVLARGVAAATTTDDYELAGGTNAAPAGQGAVDKATLITAGNTVNTN